MLPQTSRAISQTKDTSIVSAAVKAAQRIRLWQGLLILLLAVFIVRAFYVQVVRYEYYRKTALADQLRQYEVPAARGGIKAYDGNRLVPMVLNQKLYTVYADPTFVKDKDRAAVASTLADVIGGKPSDYKGKISDEGDNEGRRYVILKKKVSKSQRDKLLGFKYPGIGAQEQTYRTYPQGSMAGQVLGFVREDGSGTYGIEQSQDSLLKGVPGELKAITDASGVPLVASGDNIEKRPVSGKDVVLTLDIGIQKQTERLLATAVKRSNAPSASAVVMDTSTGAIKAMANVPTYEPAKFQDVDDPNLYKNATITEPIEIGSIMKTLTVAAALNQGVINPRTSYYDPSFYVVDEFKITNIEEDGGAGQRNVADILNLSLNTGATWSLMQMGGGKLGPQARETWYGYMFNRYRFGQLTGVEQGGEAAGMVPKPENTGEGINLTYANTSFGQAMTASTLQVAGAMSAVLNGGTYYRPHLIAETIDENDKVEIKTPEVVGKDVVSKEVSQQIVPLLQYVVDKHNIRPAFDQSRYMVGGKTGTAQIAKPGGGYYENDFNGTYLGFVGGDKPQYVIAVFMNKPKVGKGAYAGTAAAQPTFADIAHMLINNGYVAPRTK